MKPKFLYLIAALGLFVSCSEGPLDLTHFIEDLSTESSSATDSSSSIQDSSNSSNQNSSSSSNQVSSSSAPSSSFSSSVTHSSSSSILQRSSSSKKHNDMVDPGIPLSSSGSNLATIPLRSFIDSNETRAVNVRLVYPVEDGKLDTGFFSLGQCLLYEDGSFKCKQSSCMEEVGGSSAYSRYFHESTETTYLFDLNLGDSAVTSYIPYYKIPQFDKAQAKSHLETLSANGCDVLFRYEGYYRLYAEGLPEGIIFYHDGIGLNPTIRYSPLAMEYSIPVEKVTEHYTCIYDQEKADSITNEIATIQWLVNYCEKEYGSHCNISKNVPTGPIHWTLIYKDQYGRGGSVQITSEFK